MLLLATSIAQQRVARYAVCGAPRLRRRAGGGPGLVCVPACPWWTLDPARAALPLSEDGEAIRLHMEAL